MTTVGPIAAVRFPRKQCRPLLLCGHSGLLPKHLPLSERAVAPAIEAQQDAAKGLLLSQDILYLRIERIFVLPTASCEIIINGIKYIDLDSIYVGGLSEPDAPCLAGGFQPVSLLRSRQQHVIVLNVVTRHRITFLDRRRQVVHHVGISLLILSGLWQNGRREARYDAVESCLELGGES
jgi:hypothetical protein